ncbi:MBL fold metallo-hydrolase RNA specificity domain-containing protein [Streptomyces sp. NPDC059037]|uniref:MBL fold metallo-hydrolase RNA specificity domain-containing protein n=1 Tax=Streptomyces sp. NPDC059037 TaxID=3346710 RepID=UPI0036C55ACE
MDVIGRTLARKGTVVIPAFAVDLTEVIPHELAELSRTGQLPTGVPVFVDWLRDPPAPHATCLVHGEEEAARTLRDRIDRTLGWTAVVPRSGERVLVR